MPKCNGNWCSRLIDNERPKVQSRAFDWTDYKNYTEIYDWLDEQLAAFPNILTGLTIGTTFEGRPIRAVKLSNKAVSYIRLILCTGFIKDFLQRVIQQ